MKKKILYIIAAIACVSCFTGCDKWLGVKPYDKIGQEDLLSTEEGFMKLLNGIYIELNHDMLYGGALTVEMVEVMGGAYSIGDDNTVWGNYRDLSQYKYGTEYWRPRLSEIWNKAYTLILNCNLILDNIDNDRGIFTGDNYNIIRGEAMALRAMLHFDMLRLFGPVYSRNPQALSIPYYTKYTTVPENLRPASEIIGLIINDLRSARRALVNDPILTDGVRMDGPATGASPFLYYRPLRLNYHAVNALLARAYLWAGNREAAFNAANDVINAVVDDVFPFVEKSQVSGNTSNPDRIFSSEVIFALSHAQRNTLFKDYFDQSRFPNYVFRMDSNVSNRVYKDGKYGGNPNDFRNIIWKAGYLWKYADREDLGNIRNTMIPMLRLGEMYLIRAECRSDNLADGTADINELRKNRGISDNIPSLTPELLTYEYIRELYAEGQLFFMYKRRFIDVLASTEENRNPKASDEIFVVPLPDSETQN